MHLMTRRRALAGLIATSSLAMPAIARASTARKLRLGHNNTATSNVHAFSAAFQTALAETSGGALTVDIFPAGQLGSDQDLVRSVSESTLDATVSGTSLLANYFPDFGLAEVPYMFSDVSSARKAFDGKYGSFLIEGLRAKGIELVGFGESGFRHVTSNRAIRKPEDIKGLKIRVQPAKVQLEAFQILGAEPQAINFTDLPDAIRTGRVEAQENPTGVMVANEFVQKLQSHVSLTSHIYSCIPLQFSVDVFQELSADVKAAVLKASAIAVQKSRELAEKSEAANLDKLKAAGMTVVSDVDRAAFRSLIATGYDRLAAVAGKDAMERMLKLTSTS